MIDANILKKRLNDVRNQLSMWQVDGLLVTGYANFRWLSGFTGSNCKLLVTSSKALLATDFRYYEQAQSQAPHFTLFKHERRTEDDIAFLEEAAVSSLAFNTSQLSVAQFEALRAAAPDVSWNGQPQTVETLRLVKSADEIEKIRRAAAITDHAMAQVPKLAKPGMSEKQLAWQLEKAMRDAGADGLAFDILVASGANAALPHHRAGERPLRDGDTVIIDMGAMLDGYRSDLTRSFYLGARLPDDYANVYGIVQAAQCAILDRARPRMRCKVVDALARDVIANAGYGDRFGHGSGHGIGLDVHEDPFLSQRAADEKIIDVGMTLTVEPGIYLPGWGGVRIEDLTIVTESGLERLSHCPENPLIPSW